eukprot:scpid66759/ scgid0246/ 
MTFSEQVNSSSLDPKAITFQNTAAVTTNTYTLTGGTTADKNVRVITIQLTESDQNAIKDNGALATSAANTFLTIKDTLLRDLANNAFSKIETTGKSTLNVTADTTAPTLSSFDLKMTGGTPPLLIDLVFSETVNQTSATATSFTLQQTLVGVAASSYKLTGGTVTRVNRTIVRITVTATDLAAIRRLNPLATTAALTHISFLAGAINDVSGNRILARNSTVGKAASNVTADLVKPSILSFTLDLDAGTMSIVFTEAVDATQFNATLVTIHGTNSSTVSPFYKLTGGTAATATANSSILVVTFSTVDRNVLKSNSSLATQISNTYLTTSAVVVKDVAGNDAEAKLNLQANNVTTDSTSPTVLSWTLDLDASLITINFSEPVNTSSFQGRFITIQNKVRDGSASLRLTAGSSTSPPGTSLSFTMTAADTNALKARTDLATGAGNTFLAALPDTVLDQFKNKLTERTILNG